MPKRQALEYRRRAREARRMADQERDPVLRDGFLILADELERKAEALYAWGHIRAKKDDE